MQSKKIDSSVAAPAKGAVVYDRAPIVYSAIQAARLTPAMTTAVAADYLEFGCA